MKEKVVTEKQLNKHLFLYKSPLYKNTKFKIISSSKESNDLVTGLNIKNRRERIKYVFDKCCEYLDNDFPNDACGFIDGKCIVQRQNKSKQKCGCCRYCEYVTLNGCPSKNIACKLFNCSEITKKYNLKTKKDLKLLKLLSIKNRVVSSHNYFTIEEESLKDLYTITYTYAFIRMVYRQVRRLFRKDNVSIRINAVLYYSIFDAAKVIISVENYKFAVGQLAQTTMRNAVGAVTLDELLAQRDRISEEICKIIDEATDPWGIKVENVELKDISLPEEMKRVLAIAAEAEREKAAVITKAEGEAMAAENLAKAAETMTSTPGALHLRTLSTLSDISADKSNTIVVALPIEVLEAIKGKDKDKK